MEVLKEDDYQYNVGMKFNVAGWDVDADVGYGKDIDKIYTWNSGNRSLFIDTHTTPTNFYRRQLHRQPVDRHDRRHPCLQCRHGVASDRGGRRGSARRHSTASARATRSPTTRKARNPSRASRRPPPAPTAARTMRAISTWRWRRSRHLQLDVAGRAEHYTDFGDAQIGKITARYDFNPQWAIRGTISTGFRAPTLAEEFYTAVNVSPEHGHRAAARPTPRRRNRWAWPNLKPESSTSYSAGHRRPSAGGSERHGGRLLDRHRQPHHRLGDGHRSGGAINAPSGQSGDRPGGVTLDPTATQAGVTAFLNGISTLTQGVDVTLNYPTDFGDYGLGELDPGRQLQRRPHVGRVMPAPARADWRRIPAPPSSRLRQLFGFVHSTSANWKMGLTADWTPG